MAVEIPYDDIVWACTNLCDLLEYENDALLNHDAEAIRDVAENKAILAELYERSVAPMADDPGLADQLEPEQKEELTMLGSRLMALVEENVTRLHAEMDACHLLMEAVVSAVRTHNVASTYGPDGTFENQPGGDGASLTLDHTL